jgi:hypothetical protein
MKTSWSKTRKGVEFWRIYWAGYLLSLRRGVLVALTCDFWDGVALLLRLVLALNITNNI